MRQGQVFSPEQRKDLITRARDEQEKRDEPQFPSLAKMAGNLGKAVVRHVGDGLKKVDLEEYQRRLNICNKCPGDYRHKTRCTHDDCGCFLNQKAWWASEHCPEDYWETT